jgi:hypothetical protein
MKASLPIVTVVCQWAANYERDSWKQDCKSQHNHRAGKDLYFCIHTGTTEESQ